MALKILWWLVPIAALLALALCYSFRDSLRTAWHRLTTNSANVSWKIVGLAVLLILGAVVLILAIPDLGFSYSYLRFFSILRGEGGINPWLARAISLVFAGAVYFSLRYVISLRGRRRDKGWAMLFGTLVTFNLFVYASTWTLDAAPERRIGPHGQILTYYTIEPTGEWKFYQDPRYIAEIDNYGPNGEKLEPFTPEAARRYEVFKREQDARNHQEGMRREQQAKVEAERRLRETYVNEAALSSSASANRVILAVTTESQDSQRDFLQGVLADLLTRKNKRPVSNVFKSSFYADGLFDQLWDADESVLKRLRLFDHAPGCLLLCRARLGGASETSFQDLVFVQGTLSLILVTKEGRHGPWVFKASGAGADSMTAEANCAKRLVEAIDFDVIFRQ